MKKTISIITYPTIVFIVYQLSKLILEKVPNTFLSSNLGPCEKCPTGMFCDCYQYIFLGQEIGGSTFILLNSMLKIILPIFIGMFFAFLFGIYFSKKHTTR